MKNIFSKQAKIKYYSISEKYNMLFETGLIDERNKKTYYFSKPLKIIRAYDLPGLVSAFRKIEKYSKKYYLAGYISYEAGYYFENDVFRPGKNIFPLLEFCVYKKPAVFDHITGRGTRLPAKAPSGLERNFALRNIRFMTGQAQYNKNISRIKKLIASGDTYQVNYTSKYKFTLKGDSQALYNSLKAKQNVSYGAFLELGKKKILSLSPELFFSIDKGGILSKPMKGTIRRGVNILEDNARLHELQKSVKDRAENIMIVDMIRNDLGRICKTGSVKTSEIFEIEKYNTLFQMVSTVKGRLRSQVTYFDIFKNIFPGGSITGAPKLRTMQIIKELEKEPRKIYCGALGIIFPGKKKKAIFNIPIRTILLENKKGEMGVGGGVVWDSSAKGEYAEALLKSKFLLEEAKEFKLLETMLWDNGYFLLAGHLRRIKKSASYFSFEYKEKEVLTLLRKKEREFIKHKRYRVRLFLSKSGSIEIDVSELNITAKPDRCTVSNKRIYSQNRFLYHKTTNRMLYDAERAKITDSRVLDVIFLNERNEVAEGAITNVFIKKDGKYYTPPISSGLLPGVYRKYYMEKTRAVEKVLYMKDLRTAEEIILTNSVRKANIVRIM